METVTKLVIDRGAGFSHNNKSWKPTDSISTFKTTTVAADRTPDAFSLTPTGLSMAPSINEVSMSATATIAGINATVDVTVSPGSAYSIKRDGEANAESYTEQPGTIRAGDEITVRHTNSSAYATATTSTLAVGGFSTTYTTTTEALDTAPDAFSLGTVGNTLGPNVLAQVSGIIYVSGINAPTPITVQDGDTIHVRHTSSATASDNTDSVLTVGGVSSTFTSVTTSSTNPTPTPTEPTPEPTPTDPVASSGGGSMNFLYLLGAGWFFSRKRKS
jgi:hypothetical protein